MTELLKQSVAIYLIGILLSLGASLYKGTQEFNFYCHEVQLGNPKHIYFSGKGDELGGFNSCVLNTLSINLLIFFLGSALVIFIIQIIWLWSKNEWSLLKRNCLLFILIILSTLIITFSAFIFPQVRHGFLEGGTWLDRWTWYATTPITIFFISLITIFFISLGIFVSNLGPWILGLFFKKLQENQATHNNPRQFFWFIIEIVVIQIAVFIIIGLILNGGWVLFQFFNPPPKIYSYPRQIYLTPVTPEVQLYPQNKTNIKGTLNLPTPGVKPGTYNINSNMPTSQPTMEIQIESLL